MVERVRRRTPMTPRILSTAWFVVFVSLTASSHAGAPEFKAGLVTESRTYERQGMLPQGSTGASGLNALFQPVTVWCERVTVELEGERITGESCNAAAYKPAGDVDWLAEDFPLGAHVQAAIKGNELRLIH